MSYKLFLVIGTGVEAWGCHVAQICVFGNSFILKVLHICAFNVHNLRKTGKKISFSSNEYTSVKPLH